jgi:hypothetical protein
VSQAGRKALTRRALFAAVPAVVLIAARITGQAVAAEDGELIRLGRERSRLAAVDGALAAEIDRICLAALRLPAPQALYHRPGEDRIWYESRSTFLQCRAAEFSHPADNGAVDRWREALEKDWRVKPEELARIHARAREIIQAWDGHAQAQKQFRKTAGEDALIERRRENRDQLAVVETRIRQLPARTMQGAALKAKVGARGDHATSIATIFQRPSIRRMT